MSTPRIILVVATKPLSHKAEGRPKYQSRLAAEARQVISELLSGDRLYSKICYFHRDKASIDADNLSKPILDALKGIAYHDDSQIVHRVAAKIATSVDTYELIQNETTVSQYAKLIGQIASEDHVLYIEIGEQMGFRLVLGVPLNEEQS